MMKKKPPAGATLIARLKEQRLAREAEVARRQGTEETKDENASASSAAESAGSETMPGTVAPVAESQSKTGRPEALAKETKPKFASKTRPTQVEQVEPAKQAVAESAAFAIGSKASPGVPEARSVEVTVVETVALSRDHNAQQMMVRTANGNGTKDLLHRQIEIEDLRPITDDYDVLTDEIRLAGRFAAVGLIAQGLRLARLKLDAIYKDHYPTFEDYCRKEHQMSATYAYRLIRMSEMAERMAEIGTAGVTATVDVMPDPFEVMLSLGHRHLMALLPLEPEAAQELLLLGIPIADTEAGAANDRVPIGRATEKQIRDALKVLAGHSSPTKVVAKTALASEKQLIPALSKLVEMLEDWSLWLGGDSPEELEAARMGRGQLLNRLAKRFRVASGKIADALEGDDSK